MFPIIHPPCFDVISLPFLYPVSDTSLVPPATPPRSLQIYTCCLRTDLRLLADLSPIAPFYMMSVLPVDLPIAIRKGTRSTCNPHPIYNFPTYHRLFSPCSAFVFTSSSLSAPQIVHEALSHPGWKQAMIEEMAALHYSGA